MRKSKNNKPDDDGFIKNKAFENKEILGIDVSTNYNSSKQPPEETLESAVTSDVPAVTDAAVSDEPEEPFLTSADAENREYEAAIPAADAGDGDTRVFISLPGADDTPAQAAIQACLPSGQNDKNPAAVPHRKAASQEEVLEALRTSTGAFYNFCYLIGIQSYRYGKRVLVRLGRMLMKPLRYLYTLLRLFVLAADRLFLKGVRAVHEEAVFLRKEIKSSKEYLRLALKEDPLSIFSILWHYTKKAFATHKEMFRTAANLSMPLAALVVLWLTVTYWNSVTYSLKLTYDNTNIGYIQDESVYIKAQSLANEKLGDTADITETAGTAVKAEEPAAEKAVLEKPDYSLALVDLNDLSDESALFDNLIEKSEQKLTNACGIFIDGNFIGAVKNETDATGVFDSILEPYKTNDSGTIAAFVEDVRFTQGLYAESTKMMDADELRTLLAGKKAEASFHTVQAGETLWSIAGANGISVDTLLSMNPGGPDQMIKSGDKLKISGEVNYLRVKLIKTETRIVNVAFEIIKTDNPSLFKGDTRITRKGVPGQESVKELVTYIDGVRVDATEIERIRISEPIAQKVDVGTKSTTVYGTSGTYNVSVSKQGFVWPVPDCRSVSSSYGYRGRGFHNGIDIASSGTKGKIIVAAKDGVVESVTNNNSLGVYIVINHGGGVRTGYGHCLSGSVSVSPGQRVSAGQAIARVGATGNATGPHLHFNLIINGSHVNPMPYIS